MVLDHFRNRFIAEMDSNAVIYELLEKGIIDGGDLENISMAHDPEQRNQKLHLCLKKKCTDDALKTVCDVIIGVKGNPKMKALAEAMKGKLETGVCVCVCVCVCTCMLLPIVIYCLLCGHIIVIVVSLNHCILQGLIEGQPS